MTDIHISQKEERELLAKGLFSSPFFTVFASVLVTFIVAAVFLKLGGPVPISVTQTSVETPPTFETTAEGVATVVPDEAVVDLGINQRAATVAEVQEAVNTVMRNLKDRLVKLGVEEKNIKTTNYSIYPEEDYSSGRSRVIGYRVDSRVEIRVNDFGKISQAIDAATAVGANVVSGLRFEVSESLRDKAATEARKTAIDKAKNKAEETAKAAGVRLGKILTVQEGVVNNGIVPRPLMLEKAVDGAGDMTQPTEVLPGTSEVKVSVTLFFETK